jgi:hypothetical protein
MSDEKDHLGEHLHGKRKADEDRYFAEQSRKQIEKLRERHAQSTAAGQAICPRCGAALEVIERHGVALDSCPKGHGIWLDAGELEEITKRQGDSWLSRLLLGKK